MSKIDINIEYVARLARINLNAQEKKKFARQLGDILAYIEKLKQLDVSKVQAISHVLPLKNVFRLDKVHPSLPNEKVLSNAPEVQGDNFRVPRIIE